MTIVGGPVFGYLILLTGRRPMYFIISYGLALVGFFSLLYLGSFPLNIIAVSLIGLQVGASEATGTLISRIVPYKRINDAFAVNGATNNLLELTFPPLSGVIGINFPHNSAGIVWFYILWLIIGGYLSIRIMLRDKIIFHGKLSTRIE